jgi:hypothetical protein
MLLQLQRVCRGKRAGVSRRGVASRLRLGVAGGLGGQGRAGGGTQAEPECLWCHTASAAQRCRRRRRVGFRVGLRLGLLVPLQWQ